MDLRQPASCLTLAIVGPCSTTSIQPVNNVASPIAPADRRIYFKSGKASSNEFATHGQIILLVETEQPSANFLGAKGLGVAVGAVQGRKVKRSKRAAGRGKSLAWLGGGMLIMSIIVAALLLSSTAHLTRAPEMQRASAPSTVSTDLNSSGVSAALGWLAALDGQRWEQSWDDTGALFRAKITRAQWASMVRGVRDPLGAVSYRTVRSVTETTSVPNAPPGQYAIIQFNTNFAHKTDAVETVAMAHETGGWKVIGYFVR